MQCIQFVLEFIDFLNLDANFPTSTIFFFIIGGPPMIGIGASIALRMLEYLIALSVIV